MKRSPKRIAILIVLWVSIYSIGLGAGLWVISAMPGEWKKQDLEYYARQRMIEYQSNGRVSNWSNSCIATIIYDKNGRFQDFFRMDGKPFQINFLDESKVDLPEVLKGKKTLKLFPFVGNYSKLKYTSLIYIGLPMYDNETGDLTGAFFWIKDSPDLLAIMIGYVIVFTIFYVVIILFFLLSIRRERKMMQIPKKYIDNITHELKSPITSIKALTEALSDGMAKNEDEVSMYYGMIIREANRQEKMINGVLEISKLQNVKDAMPKMKYEVHELIDPIVEELDQRCDLYGIELVIDASVWEVPELDTNAKGVEQVINIIVNNAIKFSEEDQKIMIEAKMVKNKVTFCISDEGKGIPEKDLPHVFERFYRTDRSDNAGGSGLGLAIAKEIMDNMHEKIWIESKEDEGTKVFFTLTCA